MAGQTTEFLPKFASQPPSYLPDTTPLFSNAAFQLLASAMERTTATPFSSILQTRILTPLGMTRTALLAGASAPHPSGLPTVGEPASLALTTTPHDLSLLGSSILSSALLAPRDTRAWLSPASATSNLRNAVGRPWEIYHFGLNATDPVVDVYTKTGGIGKYSAYFGVAPDHDVGFSILASDDGESGGAAPDLNAYADVALEALLAVAALGRKQAGALLAGEYRGADDAGANSSLVLRETGDADPGLAVETFVVDGGDWRARTAALMAVGRPADLDFRLYPTNLRAKAADGGVRVRFQAVYQDKSAPVDQGTPTCVTWMDVGEDGGDVVDGFVFHLDGNGNATAITIPMLGLELQRY
ncbi:hypothetical protein SLS54_006887 [Diplodia seriata]